MSSNLILVLKQQNLVLPNLSPLLIVFSQQTQREEGSSCPRFTFSPLLSLKESRYVCMHDKMQTWFFCGSSRPSEQSELKLVCSEFERSELSSDIDLRSWCIQENPGEACKTDAGIGSSLPASQGEAGMEPHGATKQCFCRDCCWLLFPRGGAQCERLSLHSSLNGKLSRWDSRLRFFWARPGP